MDSEYLIRHPKDQLFYKVLAFTMGAIGLNSEYWQWYDTPKHLLYRCHRIIIMILAPVATILQLLYLVCHQSEHEFQSLIMMYAMTMVAITCVNRMYIVNTNDYKMAMEDLMTKIHLYNCDKLHKDNFVKKTLISTEKLIRWSNIYYMIFCYTAYAGFEIVPILNNFQSNESFDNITTRLEIVVHIWLPFDYEFNFTNWVITQVVMVYVGFVAITVVAAFDTTNLVFIYHMIGHIKVFKHRISILFNGDNMTQEEIRNNLISICRNYTFITQAFKNIEAAFGLNLACTYLHNLIAGGIFFYQMSTSGTETKTLFTYGMSVPLYNGILLILSFALENIRIMAEDIPDLVYGLNWESMSVSNQKLVLNLLCQVQPTLEFTAAFNIKTGVQPAVNILKTTFSFYVMIKSTRT